MMIQQKTDENPTVDDDYYYYEPVEYTDLERMILEISDKPPEPPMPDDDDVLYNFQMIYKKRKKNFEFTNEEIEKFFNRS